MKIKKNIKVDDIDSCEDCQQRFDDEVKLMNHGKTKHGENFSCNVCHKTFSKIFNLSRHKEIKHSTPDSFMEECESCLKIMRK